MEALRTKFSHVGKYSSCVINTLSLILNNRTFTSTASTSTTLNVAFRNNSVCAMFGVWISTFGVWRGSGAAGRKRGRPRSAD